MKKLVFRFNNKYKVTSSNDKKILGGKGANLSLMAKLGLPVPPGFTRKPLTASPGLAAAVDPR